MIAMCEDEFSVQPTPHGVLFSRFMVRFDSMKAIMSVSENHGIRSAVVGEGGQRFDLLVFKNCFVNSLRGTTRRAVVRFQ